ncbi:MAG: hypothetical protein JWQ00_1338, partial [Noviherbaspirillum sp.]|nr:hypothetical protein [Noviherbaspirillum sp.]
MQKKAFLIVGIILLAGIAAWYGFRPGEKQADSKRPAQQAATVSTVVAKQMNVPVQLQ